MGRAVHCWSIVLYRPEVSTGTPHCEFTRHSFVNYDFEGKPLGISIANPTRRIVGDGRSPIYIYIYILEFLLELG
jgi:hypothetical protein